MVCAESWLSHYPYLGMMRRSCEHEAMNRREIMDGMVAGSLPEGFRPAAFFLHFDPSCHTGRAAVQKHAEYFRFTGMDFVKIQYERNFPHRDDISAPEDWAHMPVYSEEFFREQIDVVAGIVEELSAEAKVIVTLYSPYMCAGQTVGHEVLDEHLSLDPAAVLPGLKAIRRSLEIFVRECTNAGVDGFYASTQGGEAHRTFPRSVFEEYIKPIDLELMAAVNEHCDFNVLHVCDYWGPYADFEPYYDYPGQIVSAGTELSGSSLSGKEISRLFGRPFLGGMDRHGVIATGTEEEIRAAAVEALGAGPSLHCLGASCTLPSETPWESLKWAIEIAHTYHG